MPGNTILELQSGIAWRSKLKRARFGNAPFYVDSAVRDSGRRIVQHEFPKRDVPYAEDMGRRAREITVRAYIIVFPSDTRFPNDTLKRKDYTQPRDRLIAELETEWPNGQLLRLPTLGELLCVCARYRITEEEKFGGYCTFDITFQEYGQPPSTGTRDSAVGVVYAVQNLGNALQASTGRGITAASGDIVA